MIGNNFWIWFMAGMIPSHYERKIDANGKKTRTIAALFWSFEASSRPDGYRHLVLHARIPFIGQLWSKCKGLPGIIWAVITQLQKPPQA